MGNYQELIFYQKARHVVKAVDALIKGWPKTMQAQEISRQLFRSAASIGANIAEGHGRHQGTEYIHYLIIVRDLPMIPNTGFIWLRIVDWEVTKELTRY